MKWDLSFAPLLFILSFFTPHPLPPLTLLTLFPFHGSVTASMLNKRLSHSRHTLSHSLRSSSSSYRPAGASDTTRRKTRSRRGEKRNDRKKFCPPQATTHPSILLCSGMCCRHGSLLAVFLFSLSFFFLSFFSFFFFTLSCKSIKKREVKQRNKK